MHTGTSTGTTPAQKSLSDESKLWRKVVKQAMLDGAGSVGDRLACIRWMMSDDFIECCKLAHINFKELRKVAMLAFDEPHDETRAFYIAKIASKVESLERYNPPKKIRRGKSQKAAAA